MTQSEIYAITLTIILLMMKPCFGYLGGFLCSLAIVMGAPDGNFCIYGAVENSSTAAPQATASSDGCMSLSTEDASTAEWKRETIYATRCGGLKYSLPLGAHDSAHIYEIETLTPAGETSSAQVSTNNLPVWFSSEDEVLPHVPAAVRRIIQLGQDSCSNQEAFRQYRSLLDSFTFSNTQWRSRRP